MTNFDRDMTNPVEVKRAAQAKKIEDALSKYGVKVSYAYREDRAGAEDISLFLDGTVQDIKDIAPFIITPGKTYFVDEYKGFNDTDNSIDDLLDNYKNDDKLCRTLEVLGSRAEVLIATNTFWDAEDDFLKIWIKVN